MFLVGGVLLTALMAVAGCATTTLPVRYDEPLKTSAKEFNKATEKLYVVGTSKELWIESYPDGAILVGAFWSIDDHNFRFKSTKDCVIVYYLQVPASGGGVKFTAANGVAAQLLPNTITLFQAIAYMREMVKADCEGITYHQLANEKEVRK